MLNFFSTPNINALKLFFHCIQFSTGELLDVGPRPQLESLWLIYFPLATWQPSMPQLINRQPPIRIGHSQNKSPNDHGQFLSLNYWALKPEEIKIGLDDPYSVVFFLGPWITFVLFLWV